MSRHRDRRTFLGALAAATVAGCLGGDPSPPRGDPDATTVPDSSEKATPEVEADVGAEETTPDPADGPPLDGPGSFVPYGIDVVLDEAIETDARIPAIDEPAFTDADGIEEATFELDDEDVVFGVERDGVAKAYPRRVLVYHEIVNDVLAGDPVSITYCPLTGTAQGFERGDGFGVSNWLFNSNLVMVDRGTETWWPQIYAVGIHEPFRGASLQEFRLVWTTWERWLDAFPGTRVMTARTGYERRYHDDPNGGYNPPSGYYDFGGPMYEVLAEPDEGLPLEAKTVVLGCRTAEGAVAFGKDRLLERTVLTAELAGVEHVAVADPALATGYVYANPEGVTVEPVGDGVYRVGESTASASSLPLERRLAFDAMWFAWYAHYPETAVRH